MILETDYRALAAINQEGAPKLVAIGNFDGVHRGHQALLGEAKKIALVNNLPLAVLTFSPHPRLYFKPDSAPFLLTARRQKQAFLQAAGADLVVDLTFDAALAGLTAVEFIDAVLAQALAAQHIVIGTNFHFGAGRQGTVAVLQEEGAAKNIAVTALDLVARQDDHISSERIRQALRRGDIATANDLLGRPWQICGEVVKGHQRGRTIGFPTANLALGNYLHPAFGVYRAAVMVDGQPHAAVVNIGRRPTIGCTDPLLEAHVLDFTGDLYGKEMAVNLLAFLRPEQKFDDLKALQAQLEKDVAQVRTLL